MNTHFIIVLLAILMLSASPAEQANDALRNGIALLNGGNVEESLAMLEIAAKTTDDPGLVAFNRGVALAKLGRWRDAEVQFTRCLGDDRIPGERKIKALSNRGICRFERNELDAVRDAIDDFTAARNELPAEVPEVPELPEVRHNLEAAKIRWLQLKAKSNTDVSPNESGSGSASEKKGTTTTRNGSETSDSSPEKSAERNRNGTGSPNATPKQIPGAGTLPVLKDDTVVAPLSPEDTWAHLDAAAKRLERQRKSVEQLRAGPDRPGVKDW